MCPSMCVTVYWCMCEDPFKRVCVFLGKVCVPRKGLRAWVSEGVFTPALFGLDLTKKKSSLCGPFGLV